MSEDIEDYVSQWTFEVFPFAPDSMSQVLVNISRDAPEIFTSMQIHIIFCYFPI